jgi:hypothetical protein
LAFFCRLDPVAAMVVDGAALDSPAATPTMKGSRLFFGICCCLTTTLDHPARMWYHRFQVFFTFLLAGYWVSSVFNPEVLDLKQRGAMGLVKWTMTLSPCPSLRQPCASVTFLERVHAVQEPRSQLGNLWVPLCSWCCLKVSHSPSCFSVTICTRRS